MQNLIIIGTGASASEITSYLEEGVFGEYNLISINITGE